LSIDPASEVLASKNRHRVRVSVHLASELILVNLESAANTDKAVISPPYPLRRRTALKNAEALAEMRRVCR
jgi:hypothetical protein